jgi:hypothetical protein
VVYAFLQRILVVRVSRGESSTRAGTESCEPAAGMVHRRDAAKSRQDTAVELVI